MSKNQEKNNMVERAPVIAIMGHIDHGKSTLLDYIRKSNIVEGEAGGITQHISAYEVTHKTKGGEERKITFLDTPGHEAFTAMRLRGASIADIAILIVSAEEGPKPQTLEAYKSIKESGIPYVVAINKIDRPGSNVEKVKQSLLEKEIYLEGLGGDIPWVAISALTGEGVPELLDTLLLVAEMEELKGNLNSLAEGFVLETKLDPKKGVCTTLVIKNGSMKTGMFIVIENKFAPLRTIENFLNESLSKASQSSPVKITGFKEVPTVGAIFNIYESKKEAEKAAKNYISNNIQDKKESISRKKDGQIIIPLIIKADVLGTIEAIQHEINKIKNERIIFKVVSIGAGNITENDILSAGDDTNALVVGFNVKIEKGAKDLADKKGVKVGIFNIIYKLSEWLGEEVTKKIPKRKVEKVIGKAKIIKIFSQTKNKYVLGGNVSEGSLKTGAKVIISRRDNEIERGEILNLQAQKIETNEVLEGNNFGAIIESKKEIAEGDIIEAFIIIEE